MGLVGRVIGHIFLSLSLPSYIFDIKLMIKSLGEILDRGERVLKRRRQGGGGTQHATSNILWYQNVNKISHMLFNVIKTKMFSFVENR